MESDASIGPMAALTVAGVSFEVVHHAAASSHKDIEAITGLPVERSVKTLVLQDAAGRTIVVAIPGFRRVQYGRLARVLGTRRTDLRSAPEACLRGLGMEPGGATPICVRDDVVMVFDSAIPEMGVVYCGGGIPTQTFKIAAGDLVRLAATRIVAPITH